MRDLLKPHEFQFPVPLVGILERDGNGLLKVFTLTKYETLVEFWSIDLPDQKYRKDAFGNDHEDKYLAYAERKSLLVTSGDASKDMITVHANKSHRIIPNSKIPHPIIGTQFVRVGNYFWIFGGFDPFHYLGHYTVPSNTTLIWSISKQKWINGPTLPYGFYGGCGIPLNRSTVLLLVDSFLWENEYPSCIHAWVYDFEAQKWHLQGCYDESLPYLYPLDYTWLFMTCGHTYDKEQKLKILMWIYNSFTDPVNPGTLILFENQKGRVVPHINAQMVNFFTIKVIKGMIFILSTDWNQNISVLKLVSNQTTLVQESLDFETRSRSQYLNGFGYYTLNLMALPFYK